MSTVTQVNEQTFSFEKDVVTLTNEEKELIVAYATKYEEPLTHMCHRDASYMNPLSEKLYTMGLLKRREMEEEDCGPLNCKYMYAFTAVGVLVAKKILNIET